MASPLSKRRRSRTLSRRLSLHQTPHNISNHSFHEASPLLCEENDDDAERRQRQKKKMLELQRKNMPSPLQSRNQVAGASLTGLTNSQIADHYKNCIQLSSENKITSKNAFGLHLIDYMSQMLQERDQGMTNFQMASCTIDASTKIYAHRVDSVHADAYKMVGGFGQANNKKSKGSAEGNNDNSDSEMLNDGKKKKKSKKSKTIATNINTLNSKKVDERFEVDPLFEKKKASFADGGVQNLLMNSLCSRDDFCELLLDSSSKLHISDFKQYESSCHYIEEEDLNLLNEIDWTAQICPQFSDFKFRNWNAKKHDVYGNDNELSQDENLFDVKSSSNHAFDINAVPNPIEDEMDDHVDADFADTAFPDNDDDDWNENVAGKSIVQPMTFNTVDALVDLLSDKPSDYSYFDTRLLSAWAGPNHWRVKPFSKECLEKKERAEQKKKAPITIDYDDKLDIAKQFKCSKKSIRLESKTLQQWSTDKTTMPEDLHYDVSCLTRLFLKAHVKLRLAKTASEVDDGVGQYNYNNANDLENFCPASQDDSDGGCDAGFDDSMDCSSNRTLATDDNAASGAPYGDAFSGNNLLQQPYKVAKININYARTAKKVDVQKLKSKMWRIMTENCDEGNKENIGLNNTLPNKIEGEMNFSTVYQTLSTKLPTAISENMSVHLAFVCFLHIVNEKCLKLVSQEDMTDFAIMQD